MQPNLDSPPHSCMWNPVKCRRRFMSVIQLWISTFLQCNAKAVDKVGLNFPPGLKVDFLLCSTRLKGLALDTGFRFWPLVSPSVFSGFLVTRLPQPTFSSCKSSLRSCQGVNTKLWQMPNLSRFPGEETKYFFIPVSWIHTVAIVHGAALPSAHHPWQQQLNSPLVQNTGA